MSKISVLMPAYNTPESFLREAIESILEQTYTDFEFLILDDGSFKNNVSDVILSYDDKRIKYVLNEKNSGISLTRNRLLSLATGEFVALMDSDDIALPHRLETQIKYFEDHPEVGVLGSWFDFYPKSEVIKNPQESLTIKNKLMFECNVIGNSTTMFRRSLLDDFGVQYPVGIESAEDLHFLLALVDKTEFANVQEVLIKYRWHNSNISKKAGRLVSLNAQLAMFQAQAKFFNLDGTAVIDTIWKLKRAVLNFERGTRISSAELVRLNTFALEVIEKIKEAGFDDVVYRFNRVFYKFAVLKAKKDALFFKVITNSDALKQKYYDPKSLKVVKFMGGLGNQMFQYAYGKAIEHFTGEKALYDPYWYEICNTFENCTARDYEMELSNTRLTYATREQVEQCKSNIKHDKTRKNYNKKLMKLGGQVYYEGYFQGEGCIKEIREELLKDFTLKLPRDKENAEMFEKIKSTNAVSIHVRRGDYVKYEEAHGLCDLEYYKKAIEYIAKRVENPHFFLFSDDIKWVEENLKIDFPYTVVDVNLEKPATFDLDLMKNCQHNIVANSSFSWWGAWLNENPQKIVVAPKQWFADKKISYKNIIPDSFVTI